MTNEPALPKLPCLVLALLLICFEASALPILEQRAGTAPPIGEESTAVQGDAIYAEFSYVAQLVAIPKADIVTKKLTIPAGSLLEASGTKGISSDKPLDADDVTSGKRIDKVIFYYNAPGKGLVGYVMDKLGSPGKFDHFKSQKLDREVAYELAWRPARPITASRSDTFRREILYQGAGGGVLRLLYREFSNDMARPAFSQELTYDLVSGEETTVAFRACRIRVLSAGNEGIRYVVQSGIGSK